MYTAYLYHLCLDLYGSRLIIMYDFIANQNGEKPTLKKNSSSLMFCQLPTNQQITSHSLPFGLGYRFKQRGWQI